MAGGQDLRRIGDFEALCRYLEDVLGWPLGEGEYDFDALTFQYEPEELGLQETYADAIESIHQLRPVVDGQPWGIFFVRFRKKKLPVGVLRRILSQLALKKRASANKAERAAWRADDLLFVSAFGEEAGRNREIAFAHFHQHGGDLPTLRVIGWDGNDTPLKLEYLQGVLADKLRWPNDPSDAEAWRKLWRSPFRHRPGHVIRKSDELAQELAKLARAIGDRAQAVMKAESAKGPLTKLYDAFKKALIHDLTREGFADTYAQTITYGLLTAAISRTEMSEGRHGTPLLASDLADMVPVTNPFLKEMLQTFLEAGGRKGGIDFDELGVQDVVELLRGEDTDLPAILRDFGNKTRGEDPVIHFYEHFLKAYNKQLKVQRGVFYTPQPVVSYIVRSVHELLQTEFGLEDGLADTITWGEMLQKHPDMKLPLLSDSPGETQTISPDEPFVQILDPATGTATFLVEVIDVIHSTLAAKWKELRLTHAQQSAAWNDYVPRHLLPRLHAYELMMAPYAIAHMKIGLKLAETGYQFGTEERARIYLTNALEPWAKQLPLIGFDALAHEATAVNDIKRHKRFTVLVGNPPYSAISSNLTPELRRIVDPYRYVAGQKVVERSMLQFEKNIQDDYVKFFALTQSLIKDAGIGVSALITNHSYLDGPTLRGLRWSLLNQFGKSWFVDLHGNSNKGEVPPAGRSNENVFDIKQGVGIAVLVNTGSASERITLLGQSWGARAEKYEYLATSTILSGEFSQINVRAPNFYIVPPDSGECASEWDSWPSITEIFIKRSTGTESGFDELLVAFSRSELRSKIGRFGDPELTKAELAQEFDFTEGHAASLFLRRKEIATATDKEFKPFQLRAYDYRQAFLRKDLLKTNSFNVMLDLSNVVPGLVTTRQTKEQFTAFAVNAFCGHKVTSSYDRAYVFPLFTSNADSLLTGNVPNIARPALSHFKKLTQAADELGISLDIYRYALAVLNAPSYSRLFGSRLKRDFPRLPLPASLELFRALANLGSKVTAIHLLESPKLDKSITEFRGGSSPEVERISWSDNTVWIDKAQTTGFRGVSEKVWNFHVGGYQVCEKWLKDRKGRTLTKDDIAHYHKIVVALSETIRLMAEIDRVIDQHGGWPGAFTTATAVDEVGSEPDEPAQVPRTVTERAPKKQQASNDLFAGVTQSQSPVRRSRDADEPRMDLDDAGALAAAIRQHLGDGETRSRDDAITTLARGLGYQRTGSAIRDALDNAIRTAVRRGILQNGSEGLSLRYRNLEQHAEGDRNGLKDQFLASLGGRAWTEREDAIRDFARWLGFRRTGPKIDEVAASLINGLLREARLEKDGSRIRRA